METLQFSVGDKVKKVTGDYAFEGTVRAAFHTANGKARYVVEHDEHHMLHIFNASNLSL